MHITINVTISFHKHKQINTSGPWTEVDTSEYEYEHETSVKRVFQESIVLQNQFILIVAPLC